MWRWECIKLRHHCGLGLCFQWIKRGPRQAPVKRSFPLSSWAGSKWPVTSRRTSCSEGRWEGWHLLSLYRIISWLQLLHTVAAAGPVQENILTVNQVLGTRKEMPQHRKGSRRNEVCHVCQWEMGWEKGSRWQHCVRRQSHPESWSKGTRWSPGWLLKRSCGSYQNLHNMERKSSVFSYYTHLCLLVQKLQLCVSSLSDRPAWRRKRHFDPWWNTPVTENEVRTVMLSQQAY